jgi:hypothetical protein
MKQKLNFINFNMKNETGVIYNDFHAGAFGFDTEKLYN